MTSLNEWIDAKIKDGNIYYVEYNEFSDVRKIGKGGFGIIESAYWENSGIKIALKTLINNNSSVDENSMDEFVKELKNIKQSSHPNINRFYGISKEPLSNKYAMVLEFANQGNLREYLANHFNGLQWNDKIQMALDIVRGLKYLHSKHIIHRDLHAKNILVNNNRLMIADFGASKQLSAATHNSIYSIGNTVGMPEYTEPQIFKIIEYQKTKKSDIYSLGVLLWEISSGYPPFLNYPRTVLTNLISHDNLREKPVDGTPQEYQQLYQKCWDDNPNSRPDIEEVHETLRSQLKIEDSPRLQFSQPSINETNNNSNIDNDDLNISDRLNSTLKNSDVDIKKSSLENGNDTIVSTLCETYDNLRINDKKLDANHAKSDETTEKTNFTNKTLRNLFSHVGNKIHSKVKIFDAISAEIEAKVILVIGGTGLGKSALCNVLTGTDEFKEAHYPISGTQDNQESFFEWSGIKYHVIDTVGIGNTGQSTKDVLKKLRSAFINIWHVLLVTDGRFKHEEIEIYDIMKTKFKESHVTIVRSKFSSFRHAGECGENLRAMLSLDRKIAKIIRSCVVIHVDNPPIDFGDDNDDLRAQINYNKKTREKSRKILLCYLERI
ncbi:hypothetical protein RclHR1_02970005 [Rhizophagus clarus]|uniref:Kinase-like domain-containing protein n=1 Tax=Rhizophagus clarus TaxID=94130 RepID=A0A2Z6R5I1_9GLOM|nr:hypothetical protein RclHR1_02970005 [Rhizophagus clarus]GES72864.1 kinase-like domain-containing protein [Rhizophagus clarus]